MDKTAQKPVTQELDDTLETQNAVLRQTLLERNQILSKQADQLTAEVSPFLTCSFKKYQQESSS